MRCGRLASHRRALLGGGFVTLALVAEWAAHTIIWALGSGTTAGHALSGSMHAYLRPTAALLIAAATVVSTAIWLLRRGAEHLIRRFRGAISATSADSGDATLARILVTGPDPREPNAALVGAALLAVQLIVYVLQENVEVHLLGLPLPGLAVLTLHHGLPLLVHVVVAVAATSLAVTVADQVVTAGRKVTAAARLFLRLKFPPVVLVDPTSERETAPPLERYGRQILARPPPVGLAL